MSNWSAQKDIDDSGVTNLERAQWASQAVGAFCHETGDTIECREDREDYIGDLLCDLLHLAAYEGFDPETLHTRALSNFNKER